jgi:hypothetical protein
VCFIPYKENNNYVIGSVYILADFIFQFVFLSATVYSKLLSTYLTNYSCTKN